jgi:diguanylate cyclase (GGDEF)-like protein
MTPMEKLADLITANDMNEILGHIHAMVALVEGDGILVSWNSSFEIYKAKSSSAVKLQECFPENEGGKIYVKLTAKRREQFVVELGPDEEGRTIFCDCTFIPLAGERQLFIAERFDTDKSVHEIIQRLNRRVAMFQVESESAKKIASNKQKEVEAVVAQVDELSNVDALTFLPNRRMIVRRLQDEVLRAQRYNTPFSISVVDVDFFKKVNDAFGHLVGDEVLRHVAYQLRDHIRHPDMVGRYGGEEFLILLPNTASADAMEQASRLCKRVRETEVPVNMHILKVTISIGVAQFRPGVDTWDSLLNRADTAMYEAKKKGRDRWAAAD